MKILGINYLSESSVALIENGEVTYAISEERLNRIKNWWGNPFKAIKHVLKKTNNSIYTCKFLLNFPSNFSIAEKATWSILKFKPMPIASVATK